MVLKQGFFVGDCVEFMSDMDEGVIDLTVTSPPYDNLRDYKGYSFDFENIARIVNQRIQTQHSNLR